MGVPDYQIQTVTIYIECLGIELVGTMMISALAAAALAEAADPGGTEAIDEDGNVIPLEASIL